MIFHLSGGSGASLNFKVVGNPQPENPSENTIWVDTDAEITGWYFSTTEPESPYEGMIWIKTAKNSTVSFNAVKKNNIQVYPVYAYQYLDGVFEKLDSLTWQEGEWRDWAWFLNASELQYVKYTNTNVEVTVSGDVVEFTPAQSSNSNWVFAFNDPIDVTDKMFLRATMNITENFRENYCGIAICSKLPTTYTAPSGIIAQCYAGELGENELEIPLNGVTGSVYVVARATYATGSITNFHVL